MWPQTITTSRIKTVLYLLVSVVLATIGFSMARDPHSARDVWGGWLCTVLFGLGCLVFVCALIRPQTLSFDADGFTLDGGLAPRPMRVLWRDIDRFFVYRGPRGVKLIGYNYRPGGAPSGKLTGLARSIGAEGGLPGGWPMSPEELVEHLEACRTGTYRPLAPKVVQ